MSGSRSMMLLALAGACAFAQPPRHGGPPPGDFAFMRGEFGFAGKVVTAAPYSAQASRTFTQTLADGTHIQRSSTASVARDSQGRTRNEETMPWMGRLGAANGTSRNTVFIQDPVASMSYVLDSNSKTVRQTKIAAGQRPHGPRPDALSAGGPRARGGANVTSEDLGSQVVQGLNATGKRVTRTLAAGLEGNDRAIQIITETWYSPDLQVVVMSKTSDPRFGETTYQLTNITRAEPDPALFTVPAGFTLMQSGRRGGPPAQ